MEANIFTETLVNFYCTTQYHIPEDNIISILIKLDYLIILTPQEISNIRFSVLNFLTRLATENFSR